jgi:hypothetical protein
MLDWSLLDTENMPVWRGNDNEKLLWLSLEVTAIA